VRRDDRPGRQAGDVGEARGVEVADVDQDPQLRAAAHQRQSGRGEPRAGVGRGGEAEGHAVAEGVRPAPDRAQRSHAGGMPGVERRQARIDRLGALQMQHDGQGPVGVAAVQRGAVGDHRDGAVARGRQPVRAADRAGGERRRLGVIDGR
jgi:hypothetical protein